MAAPLYNDAENQAFFKSEAQMSLACPTYQYLAQEGIKDINDLVEFDEDSLKKVAGNLSKPAGCVTHPTSRD
jgi:hypothetical protein